MARGVEQLRWPDITFSRDRVVMRPLTEDDLASMHSPFDRAHAKY
jgi:hypothetical protein